MMILSVLVLEIALLLVPFSFIRDWGIDLRSTNAFAEDMAGKPLMTGVKLRSWDGLRQLFVLEIGSLETVSKTLGPFVLEDHRDIAVNDCYLRSDNASLAGNLLEVGKLLILMVKSFQEPTFKPPSQPASKSTATPARLTDRLVGLPPELKASPFACAITQPQGTETVVRADLATFCSSESDIALEGNVRVTAHRQDCLMAEQVIWRVSDQELNVQGDYSLQSGERKINGRDACFSISGGGLKSVTLKSQIPSCTDELPAAAPVALMMAAGKGNRSHFGKKAIISQFSRMLLQILPAAVVALPTDQGLPPANSQGKAAYSIYRKPVTYPAPATKYSLEETVDRELFCEKSR